MAPSSTSVSIRTAVFTVMCRQPAMRAPCSGFCGPLTLRMAIKPGISLSAKRMALLPSSASSRLAVGGERTLQYVCVIAAARARSNCCPYQFCRVVSGYGHYRPCCLGWDFPSTSSILLIKPKYAPVQNALPGCKEFNSHICIICY